MTPEIITGLIMIAIFLIMALLMYLEKLSTILVLPLMAVLFAVVSIASHLIKLGLNSGLSGFEMIKYVIYQYYNLQYYNLIIDIFTTGSMRIHAAIFTTIFGGMLAIYIKNLKIAEKMIYWTAEFAGDKPMIIGAALFIVTMILFSSVGGLGAVIMIGTIILPILSSVGISPVAGAGIFLLGICAGGTMNPGNAKLYMETYKIPQEDVIRFAMYVLLVYIVCGIFWMAIMVRKSTMSNFWAEKIQNPKVTISPLAFVSPIVPVILVFFFKVDPIVAFILSLLYTFTVSIKKGCVRLFCKSIIEGSQAVMPACILMIGIGMLFQTVSNKNVNEYLNPILIKVIPKSLLFYIIGFGLAAPLALYRGPLNVWGLGIGVGALIYGTGILSPQAVMGMLISVGMIQGVCDPTNTHNVWIGSYQGITPNYILRKTLPFVWIGAFASVSISAFIFVGFK